MSTIQTQESSLFSKDSKSAVDAISMAQHIAFAPYVFQASVLLRDKNILSEIEASRQDGIDLPSLQEKTNLSPYALRVLLEAGLGIGLIFQKQDRYYLAKTGHFFLNDAMTRINTDFMRDVCYDGAQDLETSLVEGRPAGLRHLGPWQTIYQGLSILEEPAKTSWFNFDHFFSDHAFPGALEKLTQTKPRRILDIGANTGRFSLAALAFDPSWELGLVDLEIQLNVARKNIEEAGSLSRCQFFATNMLDADAELPEGYDTIWMSQFLDCFSERQVISILEKCHRALSKDGRVFINETFWDRQRFEASAFSLQMISLYFTTMANGNSQMYAFQLFENSLIRQALNW